MVSVSRDTEEEHDRKVKTLRREISDAVFECDTIKRQKETLQSELAASRQEAAGLRSTVASQSAAQEGIRAELASVKVDSIDLYGLVLVTDRSSVFYF